MIAIWSVEACSAPRAAVQLCLVMAASRRFTYPTHTPTLAFQPDFPHTAPPVPCNQTCRALWSSRATERVARAQRLDLLARPLTLSASTASSSTIETNLFGYNLELTRHGMFAGLSAQMVANRLFASSDGRWPPARWESVSDRPPRLESPGPSGSDATYAVRCTIGGGHAHLCGVRQRKVLTGFDSGLRSGSSIALAAGRAYTVRLALRSTANAGDRALEMSLTLVDEESHGSEILTR
eukprot:3233964-Prymnesium_polylepis.1